MPAPKYRQDLMKIRKISPHPPPPSMGSFILRVSFLSMLFFSLLGTPFSSSSLVYADSHLPHHHRQLQAGSELDYPPLAIVDSDGKADGFSVELLKAVAQATGLKVEFTVGPWYELKKKLAVGELDILPLVSFSKERAKIYDFSTPYLQMHGAIFIRKGDARIKSMSDLYDKEVLVMRGDTAHEYALQENLSRHLILTDTYKEAFHLLSLGKHDAIIAQHLVGEQIIKELGLPTIISIATNQNEVDIKPDGQPSHGFDQKFSIAVKKGDTELLRSIDEGLAIVSVNGTYARLYEKWFGPVLPAPFSVKKIVLSFLIVAASLILILTVFGVWYLKREVRRKTQSLQNEISIRNQREAQLHLHQEIISNMTEGVHLTRKNDGVIVFTSPKLDEMFGYGPGELVGCNVSVLNAPSDLPSDQIAKNIVKSLEKKGSWHGEILNIKKDQTPFWCQASVTIFDHYQHGAVFLSVHTDITARKEAEKALMETEKKSRAILSRSIDGFMMNNSDGKYTDANEAYCQMLGYSLDELLTLSIADLEAVESEEETAAHIKKVIETGHDRFETKQYHRNGQPIDIEISTNFDTSIGGLFFSFVRDISERKKAEEALRQSEEKYRLIAESSTEQIFQLDKDGRITFMNKAGAALLDYNPKELDGRPFSSLVSQAHISDWQKFCQQALTKNNVQGEICLQNQEGLDIPVSFSISLLKQEGQIVGFTAVAHDITDRRREEEERLRTSLLEKETLLREIHHRVKNNMQIISSILFLQAQKTTNPATIEVLEDSQVRVRTMALIHEKLYQTENLASIDFHDYITTLTSYLSQTYLCPANNLNFIIDAKGIFLSIDTAIPCGLIITELVTNSIKHACSDQKNCEITIRITAAAGNTLALSVRDNGHGLPNDFDTKTESSLGVNLVKNLAKQLNSSIEINTENGVEWKFVFMPTQLTA